MERLRYLLNKFGHIYNEEEAIEVQFRHIMLDKKVPKDIGYDEEQKDEYIGIYEELNSKIITPAFTPAFSEGLFGATLATSAPLGLSNFSTSAISFVTS